MNTAADTIDVSCSVECIERGAARPYLSRRVYPSRVRRPRQVLTVATVHYLVAGASATLGASGFWAGVAQHISPRGWLSLSAWRGE